MFVDIIMNFAVGVIAGIIGTLLLFVFVRIVLPPTKTTFWITGAITFIILLIGSDKEYQISYHYSIAAQIIIAQLGLCVGVVILYVIMDKRLVADRCPHCGSWNRGEWLEIIDHSSWDSLEDVNVKKDIYNNNGKKIGYFEDTETQLKHYSITKGFRKCSKCGGEYYVEFEQEYD